jgi:hypothetical protein
MNNNITAEEVIKKAAEMHNLHFDAFDTQLQELINYAMNIGYHNGFIDAANEISKLEYSK